MLLLPDENREALQCLLNLLSYVSKHSHTHQVEEEREWGKEIYLI